ncbi:MAG: conditioned medium factor [Anaerolineae bacterium]|nr:conditioned medium factor [Anaerolineae bacterium]
MKHKFLLIGLLLVGLVMVASSLSAAPNSSPPAAKQVAAPPAEMAQQQLPDPATNGIRSHAALIPIELSLTEKGAWQWQNSVPVDASEQLSLMLLAPDSTGWQLAVQSPGSSLLALDETTPGVSHQTSSLGIGNSQFPGDVYNFAAPAAGLWTVQVTAAAAPEKSGVNGYLVISSDSPYRLYSHLTTYNLLVGQEIGLTTRLTTESGTEAQPGSISSATMRLKLADGRTQLLPLFDDGLHQDGAANDGTWGATFIADTPGNATAQITATGTAPDGRAFIRTSEHVFPILTRTLTLADRPVRSRDLGDGRIQLNIPADLLAASPTQLLASTEVWGHDAAGTAVPIVWLSGMVSPQQNGSRLTLPLTLDSRWIELAGAHAPFELRQIRVQDVDTAVPLSQKESLPLNLNYTSGKQTVPQITDDMLMGTAPATPLAPDSAGVLMLIHGYCSGGVWPTADFSQYAVFADFNQNRSHNQFAQLIDSYGDNFSSFGAVAHSQGGAASLHLYTYYWSGLDYSSGNRLIQSVGTPYQGTALAGMIAVLGEIFGVGCGTNFDLTYDGASLWLSGIPSWARSRVYYHTTAFKDVWWRYDYCHLASDLFLSDPDDGTTERWAGQLSGANNLGHKSGWCHTNGMRDPAQYNDHTRNANMNANANR